MVRIPYSEARPGQVEAAQRIVEEFERSSKVVVLDAPTGFGKTVTVLAAAMELLERGIDRVVYVVRTRNELDPVIRELRRFGQRFSVLFSARRMCPLAMDRDVDPSSFWITCSMLRILGKCPYHKRLEKIDLDLVEKLVSDARSHLEIPRAVSDKLGVCPFFAILSLIRETKIVVATYPYVFKQRIYESILRGIVEPTNTVLIIDEAHSLANPGSLIGEELELRMLERALEELKEFEDRGSKLVPSLRRLVELAKNVPNRGYVYVDARSLEIDHDFIETLRELAVDQRMKIVTEVGKNVEEAMARTSYLPTVANSFTLLEDHRFELYVSSTPTPRIAILPRNFEVLREIIDRFRFVVAQSGTTVREIFSFLSSVRFVELDRSVVDVYRRCYEIIVVRNLSSRFRERSESTYRTFAELVTGLLKALPSGVALFVYPSYDFMKNVRRYLPSSVVQYSLFETYDLPMETVTKIVRELPKLGIHAVAGGKLCEGVEIVENGRSLIKIVAVLGAPYPQPDDYTKRLTEEMRRYGVDYHEMIAGVRMAQAIGRAVRSPRDRAIVVLADKRFLRPSLLRYARFGRMKIVNDPSECIEIVGKLLENETDV